MEKPRPDFGERYGWVKEVQKGFYQVVLQTPHGCRHYRFPERFAKEPLRVDDTVRCYAVEPDNGTIETRLEKLPEETIDEAKIEKEFLEGAERLLKRYEFKRERKKH